MTINVMDQEYELLGKSMVYEMLFTLKDGSLTDMELRDSINFINNESVNDYYFCLGELIKNSLIETKVEDEVEKLMITPKVYTDLIKFMRYLYASEDVNDKFLADDIKQGFFE